MINSIFSHYFVQIQAEKEDACVCDCKQNLVPCQNKDTERGLYLLEGRNTAYDTESPREADFWNEVPSNLILIKTKLNLWYLISLPLYYLGVIVKDSVEIEEETAAAPRSFQSDSGRSKHWTAQKRKQSPWQWINTFVFHKGHFQLKWDESGNEEPIFTAVAQGRTEYKREEVSAEVDERLKRGQQEKREDGFKNRTKV